MIMMTQTRIDQFYKVSSSGNKSAKVKNNIKMSSRSPVLGKTVSCNSCHSLSIMNNNFSLLLTV